MREKHRSQIPTMLSQQDLLKIYMTERIVGAIENITGDVKEIITNPFGLGVYLRKLAEKDDPISYIPALMIVAGIIYFVAARYGSERSGLVTLIITFFLVTLILIFRHLENLRKAKR